MVDASVAVKWLFPDDPAEPNVQEALELLADLRDGRTEAVQPCHWLAEVLAVAARVDATVARDAAGLLYAMELDRFDGPELYETAVELAVEFGHHLFDTLYHGVALCDRTAELVTADERYFQKAKARGRIRLLKHYRA